MRPTAVMEDEDGLAARIAAELLAHHACEAVEREVKIHRLGRNVDGQR